MKKCFNANKDVNLAMLQIRSTLIGNGLPNNSGLLSVILAKLLPLYQQSQLAVPGKMAQWLSIAPKSMTTDPTRYMWQQG